MEKEKKKTTGFADSASKFCIVK